MADTSLGLMTSTGAPSSYRASWPPEDPSRKVTLQAAPDLAVTLSFSSAPKPVGLVLGVEIHPPDDDGVEGSVELTITCAVPQSHSNHGHDHPFSKSEAVPELQRAFQRATLTRLTE